MERVATQVRHASDQLHFHTSSTRQNRNVIGSHCTQVACKACKQDSCWCCAHLRGKGLSASELVLVSDTTLQHCMQLLDLTTHVTSASMFLQKPPRFSWQAGSMICLDVRLGPPKTTVPAHCCVQIPATGSICLSLNKQQTAATACRLNHM